MPVDGALNAPGLTAVVTNTRSRQTMGEDQPRPGMSTLQATFVVVDQCCGRTGPSAMPLPPGPRNCGHPDGSAPRGLTLRRSDTDSATDGATAERRIRYLY